MSANAIDTGHIQSNASEPDYHYRIAKCIISKVIEREARSVYSDNHGYVPVSATAQPFPSELTSALIEYAEHFWSAKNNQNAAASSWDILWLNFAEPQSDSGKLDAQSGDVTFSANYVKLPSTGSYCYSVTPGQGLVLSTGSPFNQWLDGAYIQACGGVHNTAIQHGFIKTDHLDESDQMLRAVYEFCAAGEVDQGTQFVFRKFDDWLCDGRFGLCDDTLKAVKVDSLSEDFVFAFIAITASAKGYLKFRDHYIQDASSRLRTLIGPDRTEKLLARYR